jgi:hypothetical protein
MSQAGKAGVEDRRLVDVASLRPFYDCCFKLRTLREVNYHRITSNAECEIYVPDSSKKLHLTLNFACL